MKDYNDMTDVEKNELNSLDLTTAEELLIDYNKLVDNYNMLQQENTKLKEQIDELIKWLEEEKILEEEHLKGARYPSNNYNNCVKRICEITVVLSKLKGSDIK